jgi:cobalt/nickel transport protein
MDKKSHGQADESPRQFLRAQEIVAIALDHRAMIGNNRATPVSGVRIMSSAARQTVLIALVSLFSIASQAHFQMILPSADIVGVNDGRRISLDLFFCHPFEGHGMHMEKPAAFGVMADGKKTDLTGSIRQETINGHKGWRTGFDLRRPGDYLFYTEPQPYWEPAEDCYIVHCVKVCVSAFGAQTGWDAEIGMRAEIIPLARPYGLYAGNLFSGIVKVGGKPLPLAEVEVEYYNPDRAYAAPADPFITQIVKTDANGVFHYAMPWAGWWGFAALTEAEETIRKDGVVKPVELGAVMWVKAVEPQASPAPAQDVE